MKKPVAKSQIFTKESLTRIQDKMRNCCLLMTSAQVMELTEKEQNIFVFEVLYNIYSILKNKNL